MEDERSQIAAMTTIIAALHHTITVGMFQTITFSAEELDVVVGSRVELIPTAEGGITVQLTLREDGHAQADEPQGGPAASDHGVDGSSP